MMAKFGILIGKWVDFILTQIASDYWFSQLHFFYAFLWEFPTQMEKQEISVKFANFPLTQIYDN